MFLYHAKLCFLLWTFGGNFAIRLAGKVPEQQLRSHIQPTLKNFDLMSTHQCMSESSPCFSTVSQLKHALISIQHIILTQHICGIIGLSSFYNFCVNTPSLKKEY